MTSIDLQKILKYLKIKESLQSEYYSSIKYLMFNSFPRRSILHKHKMKKKSLN